MSNATTAAPSDLSSWKLWVYTNFDCNLRCAYCVAESSPTAPRRALGLPVVRRIVDEAAALGFGDIYFTGGEPFLLDDIYDMLAYAERRLAHPDTGVLRVPIQDHDEPLRSAAQRRGYAMGAECSEVESELVLGSLPAPSLPDGGRCRGRPALAWRRSRGPGRHAVHPACETP